MIADLVTLHITLVLVYAMAFLNFEPINKGDDDDDDDDVLV